MFSQTNSFFISEFLSPYQCYSKSLKTYDSRVSTDGQTDRCTDADRFYCVSHATDICHSYGANNQRK